MNISAEKDGELKAEEFERTADPRNPRTSGFLSAACEEIKSYYSEEWKKLAKEMKRNHWINWGKIILDFGFDQIFNLSIPQVEEDTSSKALSVFSPLCGLSTILFLTQSRMMLTRRL